MTPELKSALKNLAQADKALLDIRAQAAAIESELAAVRARLETARADHQAGIRAGIDPAARHARAQEIAALQADAEGLESALAAMEPGLSDARRRAQAAQDDAQAAHSAAWCAVETEAMAAAAESLGAIVARLTRLATATGTDRPARWIVKDLASEAASIAEVRAEEFATAALHPTLPELRPVSTAL